MATPIGTFVEPLLFICVSNIGTEPSLSNARLRADHIHGVQGPDGGAGGRGGRLWPGPWGLSEIVCRTCA
jgi:hypothetical protein